MAEWQAAMSSREFGEWQAYASMVPMPAERADLRIATVAALLAEVNRDRKRRKTPYSVSEFMELFAGSSMDRPDREKANLSGREDPERKKAEMWANLKAWALSCGARKAD